MKDKFNFSCYEINRIRNINYTGEQTKERINTVLNCYNRFDTKEKAEEFIKEASDDIFKELLTPVLKYRTYVTEIEQFEIEKKLLIIKNDLDVTNL